MSSKLPLLAYLASKPTCDVLVSQIIAYWKQRYAANAVQKIARFATMFGSVVYSHQPRVTHTYKIKAGDNERHTQRQPGRFTERTNTAQLLDTESGMRRARDQREFHNISSDVLSDISDPIRRFRCILIYPTQRSSPEGSLVHVQVLTPYNRQNCHHIDSCSWFQLSGLTQLKMLHSKETICHLHIRLIGMGRCRERISDLWGVDEALYEW